MKLYSVSDGPPSLACQQALKALKLNYELVNVDFGKGEHMTDDYAKISKNVHNGGYFPTSQDFMKKCKEMLSVVTSNNDALNPQKEIPVLVDGDLVMGESNAILQYLGDKYDMAGNLYPKDPKARALVNHRLCFNLAMYYRAISEYVMAPIFFDYERTSLGLKKMKIALDVYETYLKRENTRYAASNNLTLADFPLITATMCLEAIDFSLEAWPLVKQWYGTFKADYPDLWEIAAGGMREISYFEKNPPDLSHMEHPIHPVRKMAKQRK